ncbi:NAD(P)-dependent oxidoreductase [Mesobacillus subterraneus]|uniref:NAD(P)-dependent oxidoreductase n=1 Tax=Mesobacillus subterraneus TaxID=285983 RepID=A0A0D6ZCF0_9BACI|nr:NAD(P)-dependent oxidoreductase [Mesobacillus subterraneus]KIY22955.1 hypothetical protein UB32_05530 [Mesobacillus subterraneus]
MERAMIVGVYDFIGYSLCRHLLDMGIEVTGVHPIGEQDHDYTEEKRLEIGRNANFSEISLIEWQGIEEVDFVFVTLFELFLEQNRTEKGLEEVFAILQSKHCTKQRTALLLPAFFAQENAKLETTSVKLAQFLDNAKSSVLVIYLPTIYGPWQPENCFFQKTMNHPSREKEAVLGIDPLEWTEDCLYIDDTVNFIRKMAESGEQGQFMLASGEPDKWQECARKLLGKHPSIPVTRGELVKIRRGINVKKLKKNEDVHTGLDKQREQYSRILASRVRSDFP